MNETFGNVKRNILEATAGITIGGAAALAIEKLFEFSSGAPLDNPFIPIALMNGVYGPLCNIGEAKLNRDAYLYWVGRAVLVPVVAAAALLAGADRYVAGAVGVGATSFVQMVLPAVHGKLGSVKRAIGSKVNKYWSSVC